MRSTLARTGTLLGGLFLLGVVVDLHFGRRGFLSLDHSIAFDGGWRILSGELPFRDFTAPAGLTPSIMQAPFFAVFGVTWFAVVLHAAVVNGLACAAAYLLLRRAGGSRIESTFFAALTAFFFYPPTGTPFNDQHAFFFTLLMFLAVAVGSTTDDRRVEAAAWASVPPLFAFAFLACQIPTCFGALCVAAWAVIEWRRAAVRIAALAASTIAVAAILGAIAWAGPIDLREAFDHLVVAPMRQAGRRTPESSVIAPVRLILGTLRRLPGWANLWSLYLAGLAIVLAPLTAPVNGRWRLQLWMLGSLVFITGGFVAYTKTQLETGLGLAMIIAGVAAVIVREAATAVRAGESTRGRLVGAAAAFTTVAAIVDAVYFVRAVDVKGLQHKRYSDEEAAAAKGRLPPGLEFMRWSRGESRYRPDDLAAVARDLRDREGTFVLIGDSTILYGLTGKRSPSRALWLDDGLTVPARGTRAFDAFEADLVARARRMGARRVVLEGSFTWTHLSFDDFPRLKRWTDEGRCGERRFGRVRVLEFCSQS